MKPEVRAESWWDERELEAGGLGWRLGPLSLFVHRLDGEWQVAHQQDPGEGDADSGWRVSRASAIPPELSTVERFASGSTSTIVRLTPRPADRSVVARPRAPLHVLPGGESRFYLSAPVWVELAVGQQPRRLCELPTKRLSDTWFGSSTLDGEVAYALKTHARTRLEEVPRPAYRAITPVLIRNLADDLLLLDRMNLPIPYLSIYDAEGDGLWTEAVTLARRESDEMASFAIAKGPPREAVGARRVGAPRAVATGSPLVRAFGRLLRPFQEED